MTEDSEVFKAMKEDMAEDLVNNFIKEMKDLGFSKEDLLSVVSVEYDKES